MAKLKSRKAAQKRFTFSSKGKVSRRKVRQAHFNARATGNENRRKHASAGISPSDRGRLKRLLPHQQ